jgi:hypothetical protein
MSPKREFGSADMPPPRRVRERSAVTTSRGVVAPESYAAVKSAAV